MYSRSYSVSATRSPTSEVVCLVRPAERLLRFGAVICRESRRNLAALGLVAVVTGNAVATTGGGEGIIECEWRR